MEQRKSIEINSRLEWDEWYLDAWEVFDDPKGLTPDEIQIAQEFLSLMKIDIEEQSIITFRATPADFANLAVNYYRRLKSEFPRKFSEKFL
jgi:hypothetical protein